MTDGILTADEIASVRREYRGASLLPKRAYHDPAIFDWERANVLRRDWVMVAREEDVPEPGTYLLVELDDDPLIDRPRPRGRPPRVPQRLPPPRAPPWPRSRAARSSASSARTTPGSTTSMAR